jgi:hypothetical protein
MQLAEILLKLLYYMVWLYPGIIYLPITIPLSLGTVGYGLRRWTRLSARNALLLAFLGFLGSWVVTTIFSGFTGLVTPGSKQAFCCLFSLYSDLENVQQV